MVNRGYYDMSNFQKFKDEMMNKKSIIGQEDRCHDSMGCILVMKEGASIFLPVWFVLVFDIVIRC